MKKNIKWYRIFVSTYIERVGFNNFRAIARTYNLTTGRGKEDCVNKVSKQLTNSSFKIAAKELLKSFKEHILYSEKAIQFYDVDPDAMKKCIKSIKNINIESSVFTPKYPLPLTQEKLKKIYKTSESKPVLVSLEKNGNDIILVFSSSRFFTQQTDLTDRLKNKDVPKGMRDYDELIGRRRVFRQFYDLIIFRPDKNMIELAIDSPDTQEQMQSMVQRKNASTQLRQLLDSLTHKAVQKTKGISDSPIDLFSAITPIVHDSKQGLLKLLYFITDEALEDHAFAKKTERYKDLRDDTFLKDGRKNTNLDVFRCAVEWPRKHETGLTISPRLELLGSITSVYAKTSGSQRYKPLREAIVRGGMGEMDYVSTCKKLFQYIESYEY